MNTLARVAFCMAVVLVTAVSAQGQEKSSDVLTAADLEAALAELEDKKTRLAALERLIPFASMRVFQVGGMISSSGNDEKDALIRKATDAISQHHNFATFDMALNSSSETLQHWALFNLPLPPFDDSDDPLEDWIPRLRELATSTNSNIRDLAHDRLFYFDGQREFLTKRLWEETSLTGVMRLLHHLARSTYQQDMNSHVLRFLNDEEKAPRLEALSFVAWNSRRARMWQVDFNDEVLAKVLELSHSADAGERSSTVLALSDLRKNYRLRQRESDAVRQRILELADDPSANVRWVVPPSLREDDLERPEVQAVLARLLKDESPLVRYFAIVALGPEKHVAELRKLASGSDKQVAEFAQGKLKQLEQKK